jgi:uncharacterized protein
VQIDFTKVPIPVPTPETEHFWVGTSVGELRLQQCTDCQTTYFPPRPFCPVCSSRAIAIVCASGRASLASYVINQRPHPAFDGPYAIALVELEEGVRMMSNLLNVEQTPDALILDMPLQVTFQPVGEEIFLPYFEPRAVRS